MDAKRDASFTIPVTFATFGWLVLVGSSQGAPQLQALEPGIDAARGATSAAGGDSIRSRECVASPQT